MKNPVLLKFLDAHACYSLLQITDIGLSVQHVRVEDCNGQVTLKLVTLRISYSSLKDSRNFTNKL